MKPHQINKSNGKPIQVNPIAFYAIATILIMLSGCQKEFLSKVPDKSLLVPTTLADFQSLLDNSTNVINLMPSLNVIATDDFHTTDAGLSSIDANAPYEQNTYLFAENLFSNTTILDWDTPYQQVFYANVVLDGLVNFKTDSTSISQYNEVRGSALFVRAFAFYNLVQEFAVNYNPSTAATDLGIPLRLTPDINQKSVRSTIQQTYAQLLNDLTMAQLLLPKQALIKSRPTSIAALALMARIYLTMGIYDKAESSANAALQLDDQLIDYNSLNPAASKPLPPALPDGNNEVIYYSTLLSTFYSISSLTSVDSLLFNSYATNDLRKEMFFRNRGNGIFTFKGTYSGGLSIFGGLATDELFLIRAECEARLGQTSAAMNDLNTVLMKRWVQGSFIPLTANNANDALITVLTERRKELVGRGLRWSDLRRLNTDPQFAVTVTHTYNGQMYTLAPNDKRYVFPIPPDEIANSGIQQNPR